MTLAKLSGRSEHFVSVSSAKLKYTRAGEVPRKKYDYTEDKFHIAVFEQAKLYNYNKSFTMEINCVVWYCNVFNYLKHEINNCWRCWKEHKV